MQNLDPTYLRYIYDNLIKGSIHPENESELPDGLIGLYEEAFEEHLPVMERQQTLKRFAIFALLKKEVSVSFVAEVLDESEEELLTFISVFSSWFNSPESVKYQMYHERLKVYLLQKLSKKEIQIIHEKLIVRLEQAIEEQKADEFERYALEFLSGHLLVEAFENETKGKKLLEFTKNEANWDRQIRISNKFDWSRKGLHHAASWTSKHDQEENIDCYLDLVQLHNKEQNDAESIVRLVANNEIDLALERITAFGGPSKEEKERQFILFMLCLMELTLLESKTQPWRKEAIEKLLKHLEDEIPVDHSLVNWGEFFSSYLMFLIICQIWGLEIKFLILYKLTNFWDKEWIDFRGPFTIEQKYILEIGSEIAISSENPNILAEPMIHYGLKDFQKIKNDKDLKDFIINKNQNLITSLNYKNHHNHKESILIFNNLFLKYEFELILKQRKIYFDTNNEDLVLSLLKNANQEYILKIIDYLVSNFFENKIYSYSIHRLNFLLNTIIDFLGLNHFNSSIYFLENIYNRIQTINIFDSFFKTKAFHCISIVYSKLNLNEKAIYVLNQALILKKQEHPNQISNKDAVILIDIFFSLFNFGEEIRALKELDDLLKKIKKDFWTYKDSLMHFSLKFSEVGNSDKSIEIIDKYFLNIHELNKAYFNLVDFLLNIDKIDIAIQLIDKISNEKMKNDLLLAVLVKLIKKKCLFQAEKIASKINLLNQKVEAYSTIYIYLKDKRFKSESENYFKDTIEIIDTVKNNNIKNKIIWIFIQKLINSSLFDKADFIYKKYNINCKEEYICLVFNKKVELNYFEDCFDILFFNLNYLEQIHHIEFLRYNIKQLGYNMYLNNKLYFIAKSLKLLSPKIFRNLSIGIVEAIIQNTDSIDEIKYYLHLINREIQHIELLIQKYVIYNILFPLDSSQEKIEKFNRVLNLQWAIDLKKELDELPN
jgi:hypothetical protein